MSVSPLVAMILVMTSCLCVLMNSWICIWVMLEINTLSFCFMSKTLSKNKKAMSEMSMKYFVIQSISSALLVFSSISSKMEWNITFYLLALSVSSLMIKMASAPFHQWFVYIVKFSKWKSNTILMTWQKLAPTYLVIYQLKKLIFPFVMFSALSGVISQMNKKNSFEIMAFSSIFNLSWIMIAIITSFKLFVLFCVVYWVSVTMTMLLIQKTKMKNLNSENMDPSKKWIYMMVLINLAGIPPLAGFVAKWMVVTSSIQNKFSFMVTLLLITSSINLYIYLRMFSHPLLKSTTKSQKTKKSTSTTFSISMILLNLFPMMMMIF